MYKATLVSIIIAVFLGYLYFSRPVDIVVNEEGNVEGLVNKGRALIQGNKFWRFQLKIANELYNKSLVPHLPSSAEMRELYKKLREDEIALNEKMKSLYTLHEQMANMLRMKADSIERAGKWSVIDDAAETANIKESEKLKAIIPIIEGKLKSTKPQTKPVP